MLFFNDALELRLCQLDELEGFFVLLSYIIAIFQAIEVEFQVEHLFIFWVVVEANDWYTIIQLEGKRVDTVVD